MKLYTLYEYEREKKSTGPTNKYLCIRIQFYCAIEIYLPFQVNGRLVVTAVFSHHISSGISSRLPPFQSMTRQRSMDCVNLNENFILNIFFCCCRRFGCCNNNMPLMLFFHRISHLTALAHTQRKKWKYNTISLEMESYY